MDEVAWIPERFRGFVVDVGLVRGVRPPPNVVAPEQDELLVVGALVQN